MGRWSGDHYDDMLKSKFKSLVTGAIIRAKLDRSESGSETPVITYEKLVEELSSGDAFATSMIDAMVEEISDRRNRPVEERDYISQNTAKALRSLSSPHRILRERTINRRYPGWRTTSRAYLHPPPDDNSAIEPEAEDFETILDNAPVPTSVLQSIRNPHDSYTSWVGSSALSMPHVRDSASPPLPAFLTDDNVPSSSSPPTQTSASAPTSSLPSVRHISMRRPTRAHMDFNGFSAQRRAEDRASRIRMDSTVHDADNAEIPEAGLGPSTRYVRRFFPLRHHHRNPYTSDVTTPWVTREDSRDLSMSPGSVEPHAFSTLFSIDGDPGPTAQMFNEETEAGAPLEDRTMSALPRRLRRGGIHPPESLSASVPRNPTAYMLPSPSASSDSEVRLLVDGPIQELSPSDVVTDSLIEGGVASRSLPTPPFTTENV